MLLSTCSSLSSKKQADGHKKISQKRDAGLRVPTQPCGITKRVQPAGPCWGLLAAWRGHVGMPGPNGMWVWAWETQWRDPPPESQSSYRPSSPFSWVVVKGAGQQEGPPLAVHSPLPFLVMFRCTLPMMTDSRHRTRALLAQDLLKKNLL